MDPNLFHVDWDQLIEILALLIVLSFFVERALSLVFEHRWYVTTLDHKGLKAPIAFVVAFVVCIYWNVDAVAVVARAETTSLLGTGITAAVIAGGSKASIKLFQDLMGVRSDVVAQKKAAVGGGT